MNNLGSELGYLIGTATQGCSVVIAKSQAGEDFVNVIINDGKAARVVMVNFRELVEALACVREDMVRGHKLSLVLPS